MADQGTADEYVVPQQAFDVVCLKDGVSELMAKPEDFKRVPIDAESPYHALMNAPVEQGFRPMWAINPGVLSDAEIHARRRSFESEPVDHKNM
jgi:hypothetical protein